MEKENGSLKEQFERYAKIRMEEERLANAKLARHFGGWTAGISLALGLVLGFDNPISFFVVVGVISYVYGKLSE